MTDTLTPVKAPTKGEQIAHIRQKLGSDPLWAVRGLIRVYEAQTQDEQSDLTTKHVNGVGFTGVDAPFLTSLAQQVIRRGQPSRQRPGLSPKQMEILFKKMPKYAGQLWNVSHQNG